MNSTPLQGGCAGCHSRGCASACTLPPVPGESHPWLDRFFLHPRWGLVGSLLVFAAVLFVVFEVSAWIDAHTTARLAEGVSGWEPAALQEVIAKAIVDGLIGLAGIVLPYMIPLVFLLVAL